MPELTFQRAADLVGTHLEVKPADLEPLTRDFLNRSFLRRSGDVYAYAHKSIGDYMIARACYARLRAGDVTWVGRQPRGKSVPGLILEMCGGPLAWHDFLTHLGLAGVDGLDASHLDRLIFASMALSDRAWELRDTAARLGFGDYSRGAG